MMIRITKELFPAVFLSVLLLAGACSKEETTTTKSYLSGTLSAGNPTPYHYGNDSVKLVLSGVFYPSTDTDKSRTIGIYYTMTSVQTTADTVFNALTNPYKEGCSFSVYLPDSLGTYTVSITAYPSASDVYYSTSTSVELTVVDDFATIPQIDPHLVAESQSEIFSDPRDGRKYVAVSAGGNVWLNRNLAYGGTAADSLSIPYGGMECMRYIFGGYYTQSGAAKACPDGWKLPSAADWKALGSVAGDLMADAWFNGETKLWEYWPQVKITNKYRFGMIPSGYCNPAAMKFSGEMGYASFWTSDTVAVNGVKYGVYEYVYVQDNDVKEGMLEPEAVAMSVRCIKDR